MTQEGFQRVVAEAVMPVEQLLEGVVHVEIVGAAGTAVGTLAVADGGVVVGAVHVGTEADVALDREGEVLQEGDVGEGLGARGDALVEAGVELGLPEGAAGVVLRAAVELTGIVLLVAVLVEEVAAVRVVEVHRIDRGHDGSLVQRVGVRRGARAAVVRLLPAGGEVRTGFQPLDGRHAHVGAAAPAHEVGVHGLALLVEVTQREVVVALVGGTRTAHVVVLAVAVAHGVVPPVKVVVTRKDGGRRVELAVGIEEAVERDVEDVVLTEIGVQVLPHVGDGLVLRHVGAADQVVHVAREEDLHEVLRIHLVVFGDGAVEDTLVHAHVEAHAVALAALGGDQDHTVGSTVTVQGGGGGVLQHGEALDVVRVQVGDVTAERNAVDDIERGVVTGHGTDTADADGSVATRVAGRQGEHARGHTFQHIRHAGDRALGDGVGLHGGDGARHGLLLGHTVGHDHEFFKALRIGGQQDVDHGAAFHGGFLVEVADGAEDQSSISRHRNCVVAVCVGSGTGHGALDLDRSERNAFAGRSISHLTADVNVLSISH